MKVLKCYSLCLSTALNTMVLKLFYNHYTINYISTSHSKQIFNISSTHLYKMSQLCTYEKWLQFPFISRQIYSRIYDSFIHLHSIRTSNIPRVFSKRGKNLNHLYMLDANNFSPLIIQELKAASCCLPSVRLRRCGFIEKLFTRVHFRLSAPEMEYYSLFLDASHNKVHAVLLRMTHVWSFSRCLFPFLEQ